MSARIIPLGNVTRLDIPVERILDQAKDQMDHVVIMGWDKNGELYFASSFADDGEVMWLLEKCKQALFHQ